MALRYLCAVSLSPRPSPSSLPPHPVQAATKPTTNPSPPKNTGWGGSIAGRLFRHHVHTAGNHQLLCLTGDRKRNLVLPLSPFLPLLPLLPSFLFSSRLLAGCMVKTERLHRTAPDHAPQHGPKPHRTKAPTKPSKYHNHDVDQLRHNG